ncbi:MAG: UPF0149 family protein [Proteobacteria bacterium]|nr:UPF0149 family protein [Pseudomonadota bacterium]
MTTALAPFSDEDFETLSDWLMRRGKGIYDIVELEGFLTAIVIGPNTLSPLNWLPKVWGGRQPRFKDLEEMNRFTALVIGYYNDIAMAFEVTPGEFEPTFYEPRRPAKGSPTARRILIVDEWCVGFLKGMRLDSAGWKPLTRERPELLKPIQLFGTRKGWDELKAGGEVRMHGTWSVRVAPAVRDIYAYWMPHRRRMLEARARSTIRGH